MRRVAGPIAGAIAIAALTACGDKGNVLRPAVRPDTFTVLPSDQPQVLVNSSGKVGVKLEANSVSQPTKISFALLDSTGTSPLVTKLDKYPGYVAISQSGPLIKPAIVAVCPPSNLAPDLKARLRLGHQRSNGFEITPPADGSFLDCSGLATGRSRLPGWLRSLASLVLPKPLYAKMRAGGGVGGTASEFSPFGPVDPELRALGGVGGVGSEFQTSVPGGSSASLMPGARSNTVVNGVCTAVEARVGSPLEPECRPGITLKTAQGTVMQNVPVSWAVSAGGGTVAPEATGHVCGAFGTTAASTTNTNGKAGACWTLGAAAGVNTVALTPGLGGDAVPGVVFNPPTVTYNATAIRITPVVSATGGNFTFDNVRHAGSGTCSNGLVPQLTYTGNAVPLNAGSYTLTVTCGAGDPLFQVATATATIVIAKATPVLQVDCPASVTYSGVPLTPCNATIVAPGLSLADEPTYSSNLEAGTATATLNYAGAANYNAASTSKTFTILPLTTVTSVLCPVSVPYSGATQTPCTAKATGPGGFTKVLSVLYAPTAPREAGLYSAKAAVPTGGSLVGSSATGSVTITKLDATATAGSGSMTPGGTVPPLPCVVTGLLPSDAGVVTCTTGVPSPINAGVNVTTPILTPTIPPSYAMTLITGTLTAGYVQQGCFGLPLAFPPVEPGVTKGSDVPVSCRLLNGSGTPVLTATGDLKVFDKGPNGLSDPVMILYQTNAFAVGPNGTYTLSFSTSPADFIVGHFYGVYAFWDDGSQSVGWFQLKP